MVLFPEQEETIGVVRQVCPESGQLINLVGENTVKLTVKSF